MNNGGGSIPGLEGKIAVVTGASRGAGRGIAQALGEAGATVYVTGRSVGGATTNGRPETIHETAEMLTVRGGVGISVRVDHTVDAEVEALFERVGEEQGRLDLLVNNAWGGNELSIGYEPFWELPLDHWRNMFTAGVRSHLVSSRFAVRLMLPRRQGLIINTSFWDRGKYTGNFFYDLAKNAMNRMAYGMAHDLREYNIAAVALSPGWMRTELVLAAFKTDEQNWHKVEALKKTESTQYIGRAVAALAADPNVMQKSGSVLKVGDLACEYGFTDIEGTQPPPFTMDDV
jgi:NAD(P)-dependent dehydrogenase (short-subunit alcohol dehydrogenase family)